MEKAMTMKTAVPLAAAVAAALVALSGCVAYPATSYSREYYGSDAEWQRQHHHRDHWNRYYEYDERDSRDARARGQ